MPGWKTQYGPMLLKNPLSWRLVDKIRADGKEIIFTLQGVIQSKELPPIIEDPQ